MNSYEVASKYFMVPKPERKQLLNNILNNIYQDTEKFDFHIQATLIDTLMFYEFVTGEEINRTYDETKEYFCLVDLLDTDFSDVGIYVDETHINNFLKIFVKENKDRTEMLKQELSRWYV